MRNTILSTNYPEAGASSMDNNRHETGMSCPATGDKAAGMETAGKAGKVDNLAPAAANKAECNSADTAEDWAAEDWAAEDWAAEDWAVEDWAADSA